MISEDLKRLGSEQRRVGAHLTDKPLSYHAYGQMLPTMELGYLAATLIRLVERGVAVETALGMFARGPRWDVAAEHFHWLEWLDARAVKVAAIQTGKTEEDAR